MDDRRGNDFLKRLGELEREIRAVRRELTLERPAGSLPQDLFQAARVLVGKDEYGVPCAAVREIVRFARLTRIAGASRALKGTLNLRGEPVPVVDVPVRLGLGEARIDLKTPIVIVNVRERSVGLVVDRVIDVVTIDGREVDDPTGALADCRYVVGVAYVADRLVQVLNLDELVSPGDIEALDAELSRDGTEKHSRGEGEGEPRQSTRSGNGLSAGGVT